jgi:hypothetical protein
MSKTFNIFIGGLILIAVLAVLFTKPNTSSVINSTGKLVSSSFSAAEAG